MAGRTTVLIAHRRSTLELADQIAVLDEGRLVDLGTHEELTERCPLYRLLLSGPGDDAEGVDAGELSSTRTRPPRPRPPAGPRPARGRITAEPVAGTTGAPGAARPRPSARAASAQLATTAAAGDRPRQPERRRLGGGPRSPVAAQPGPAPPSRAAGWTACRRRPSCWPRSPRCRRPNDTPDVDESFARAPDTALHAAPAAAAVRHRAGHRAGPGRPRRARQHGHATAGQGRDRQRRRAAPAQLPGPVARPSRWSRRSAWRIVLADWGDQLGPDHRGRPQRRAAAVHAAGEDLRPAPAARAGLLRARADRPDHDPDDHGRGRAVLVLPDRPDHHGELAAHLRRWCWP